MRHMVKIVGICLVIGIFTAGAWAVPRMINYQGAMVDTNGVPLDGLLLQVYFNMWDDSVLGNFLWSEVQDVQITDGLFNVLLGRFNPIPRTVFDEDSVWLEVGVDYMPPMTPRHRIATVAYAFHAAYADTAGVALSGGVNYALVYTVAQSGGDFTSVLDAINAIPGGVGPFLVRVMPGLYLEPMLPLTIPQNVTLRGAGRESCFLDCG